MGTVALCVGFLQNTRASRGEQPGGGQSRLCKGPWETQVFGPKKGRI